MDTIRSDQLHILLIMQERSHCELFARYLGSDERIASVDAVNTAAVGIRNLRQRTYDVLVMDRKLGENGDSVLLDAMRAGSVRRPEIIIMMLGMCDEEPPRRLNHLGVSQLLRKPCLPHRLLDVIMAQVARNEAQAGQIEQLYNWLLQRCNPRGKAGPQYLARCVQLCMKDNTRPAKALYIDCARSFGTTPAAVESAIRALGADSWIGAALHTTLQRRLTNGMLIRLLAERKELWMNS